MNLLQISCVAAFVFFSSSLFSQDIIYKSDGSREEAIIKEVNDKDVTYKRFDNPEGPDYVIRKKDVIMVTYQNGNYELMNASRPDNDNLAPNLFSYNLFDLVWNRFTVSYERILKNGKTGIKVPVSFGYNYNDEYTNFDFRTIFGSGIGVNFYPTGQGKWKYFMGPELNMGYGKEQQYYYYYDEWGNYVGEELQNLESFYGKFLINNGVIFTPVANFSVSAFVSLGVRYVDKSNFDNEGIKTDGAFAFNLSYRF
jgi:hypothetical protein